MFITYMCLHLLYLLFFWGFAMSFLYIVCYVYILVGCFFLLPHLNAKLMVISYSYLKNIQVKDCQLWMVSNEDAWNQNWTFAKSEARGVWQPTLPGLLVPCQALT